MSGGGGGGAPARPELERPWRGWRKRTLHTLYVLLGLVALYEVARALGDPGDFEAFVTFGEVILEGRVPYLPEVEARYLEGTDWATWPPSFGPFAVALALAQRLAGPGAILGWQVLNLAGLAALLGFCARWSHGRRLSLRPGPGAIPLLALPMAVALFVPLRLLLSNFEHEQANLLILGLAVGGVWLMGAREGDGDPAGRVAGRLGRRGARWAGGLLLGASTAFKGTALLLVPYLAWRGRWRDLGAGLAGCALAWGVLPAVLYGPGELPAWYGAWAGSVGGLEPGSHLNQSLQAALGRALGSGGGGELAAAVAALPGVLVEGRAALAAVGLGLAVLVGGAIACGRPLRAVSRRREALELGLVLAAMALFSPLAWKAHYAGLPLLAGALFAFTPRGVAGGGSGGEAGGTGGAPDRMGGAGGRPEGRPALGPAEARPVYAALAAAFLAVNFTSSGLIGGEASDALEAAGVVTWSALALVAAGIWTLWRVPHGDASGPGDVAGRGGGDVHAEATGEPHGGEEA